MSSGIRAGARRLFRLGLRRADLAASDAQREIDFHLDERIAQLVRGGMTPHDARAEAMRRFGDVARTHAELSASTTRIEAQLSLRERLGGWLDDVRYVARSSPVAWS